MKDILKTTPPELLALLFICLSVIGFVLFGQWLWEKTAIEREHYQRVQTIIEYSQREKIRIFCEEYRKFTKPQNAPYAYRTCWD